MVIPSVICSGVRVLGEQCVLKQGGGLLPLWDALQLLRRGSDVARV
jgi:hypothetical protein